MSENKADPLLPFQRRVQDWMMATFSMEVCRDTIERNHRFLEEALELVQASGCTASEAYQLVDYVYGRDQGEINQEVGGVMVTLAALCLANDIDMHQGGEAELARVWTKIDQIRAKQATKPKHSPLPQALVAPQPAAPLGGREALARMIRKALVENWRDDYDGRQWDEDVLLTGCRKVGGGIGYQKPEEAAQRLSLDAADAILAAIPQERGVDRAAIIKECVKAAESVEMGRKWSDDPDMQNQGYYTEGEILIEIVDAIRALGKGMGRR